MSNILESAKADQGMRWRTSLTPESKAAGYGLVAPQVSIAFKRSARKSLISFSILEDKNAVLSSHTSISLAPLELREKNLWLIFTRCGPIQLRETLRTRACLPLEREIGQKR